VAGKQHPIDRQFTGFSDRYRKRYEAEEEELSKVKYKIRARRPAPKDYIKTQEQEEAICRMENLLKTL